VDATILQTGKDERNRRDSETENENGSYKSLTANFSVTEAKRPDESFDLDEDEYGTYLMNSKDLCAIELLAELRDAGICSFKVEGRSKSIYYAATVARAYRRAIDDMHGGKPFDKTNLMELFATANRTMMTGFMVKRPLEYGENFEDGESLPLTHRFAGEIREYDPATATALVDIKNRIRVGEELEYITPEKTVQFQVTKIVDPNDQEVEAAHGGLQYRIAMLFPPEPFALLRQVL
jgi:putative protease